jgi:hypothetical protein
MHCLNFFVLLKRFYDLLWEQLLYFYSLMFLDQEVLSFTKQIPIAEIEAHFLLKLIPGARKDNWSLA